MAILGEINLAHSALHLLAQMETWTALSDLMHVTSEEKSRTPLSTDGGAKRCDQQKSFPSSLSVTGRTWRATPSRRLRGSCSRLRRSVDQNHFQM
jgi:hypothetical protein